MSSAVAAREKITNGTRRVTHRFQPNGAWAETMPLVVRVPDTSTTARTERARAAS